jgi:hypothetical protein
MKPVFQIYTPMFIALATIWKQLKYLLMAKWIRKFMHTHVREYHSALKDDNICSNIDELGIHYAK